MSAPADPAPSMRDLAFWAPPEVWRALIDGYNDETNRTHPKDALAADDLAATIRQATDEALRP